MGKNLILALILGAVTFYFIVSYSDYELSQISIAKCGTSECLVEDNDYDQTTAGYIMMSGLAGLVGGVFATIVSFMTGLAIYLINHTKFKTGHIIS